LSSDYECNYVIYLCDTNKQMINIVILFPPCIFLNMALS
jgi:hypothetical protein